MRLRRRSSVATLGPCLERSMARYCPLFMTFRFSKVLMEIFLLLHIRSFSRALPQGLSVCMRFSFIGVILHYPYYNCEIL